MAAEATVPCVSVQHSTDKDLDDDFSFQLVNQLIPGNSIINVSFVTAREVSAANIEHIKATLADHFSQHFQTPIRQVDLSVNVLDNTSMATSVKVNVPALTEEIATSPADHDTSDGTTNDVAPAKAKGKVPRPPNAFIIYRKEWHPVVVAQNPGVHNNAISVIIGNKWKNESQEIRDKYQRKAAEAKYNHQLANPGYQYQPRKPSEKKKRMTKNKLAKLAAKSAAAKSSTGAHLDAAAALTIPEEVNTEPLLTFNDDMTMMSFHAGSGTAEQLATELNAHNNSKFTATQQANFHSRFPMPAAFSTDYSTATAADSVNMDMIVNHPLPTSISNFTTTNTGGFDDFAESAEDYFHEFNERDIEVPTFEEVDVVLPQAQNLATCEVVRQAGLNEEFGLNDFFDFERFES